MLVIDSKEKRAYDHDSRQYWQELYNAIRKEIDAYNGAKRSSAHLSIGDPATIGERDGIPGAFPVQHDKRRLSPTELTLNIEDPFAYAIEIQQYLAPNNRYVFRLRRRDSGGVEAHSELSALMPLSEVVKLIVDPLKELGEMPGEPADPLRNLALDDEMQ